MDIERVKWESWGKGVLVGFIVGSLVGALIEGLIVSNLIGLWK